MRLPERPPARLSILVLVAALAVSACGAARAPAAVVDGQPITDQQLSDDMAAFRFLSSLNQQPCGQPDTSIGESARSACARLTLAIVIQEDLVRGYAASHHITVDAADVTKAVSQLEASLGGTEKLDQQLRANGMTHQRFLAFAERLLLLSKTERAIGAAGVSEDQLRQAYAQQKQQFLQIHAKHILVTTEAEAARIARKATPKDFGALAKKYSTDTSSAQNGGDLGTLPASQLDPTFVQAALALKPGQISGPVQTQFGWNVILLVSATTQPFAQVRDQLAGPLESQVFSTWLQGRIGQAEIRVNPKFGRLDTATGQIVPIRSTASVSSATPSASSSA